MTTATPRKATAAKKAASNVVDFDAARKKPARKKHQWKYAGRVWDLKEPNAVITAKLEDMDSLMALIGYVAAHVVKDQREDFLKALSEDETLDFEVVNEMAESMMSVVFGEIPT